MTVTTYTILFSANLTFIVTHLYGWLLKWFYRPEAYSEHFHELFPAQRAVGFIYLLQIFELPYLLQIGNRDALLYVNAFSLLFFSIQMMIMCESYFFPNSKNRHRIVWLFVPAFIVLAPMFLQAVGMIHLPEGWRWWAVGAVSLVFDAYFIHSLWMALRIRRAVRRANESTYADSDDFPVHFANIIKWVPTIILILLAINFYADNIWVKFARDTIFIGANVWFCILTLNPWRKVLIPNERNETEPVGAEKNAYFLSDNRCDELAQRLEKLFSEEHIFTEQHITIDTLIARLGTNSKYVTEVIRRSGYQSFYDMVCRHRVHHAISLIRQNPDERLIDIADQCGFSSSASMSKAFKSQGKKPPSHYRQV